MLLDGRVLRFYTDSGGGFNAIKRSVALDIRAESVAADVETVDFPEFVDSASIPANPVFRNGQLQVVDEDMLGRDYDGFLGGRWFANRVWEFDYSNERLTLYDELPDDLTERMTRLPLGFQVDDNGIRTMHFPSMPISIDGEEVHVLFDTGARATLTENSAGYFRRRIGESIGASFMCEDVFDRWRAEHPEWPYIESADSVRGSAFPMIQVPQVSIAGIASGPVWFVKRADPSFKEYMTQFMDREICGAIGGSGLQYYQFVIDYPAANLWLRPRSD